MNRAVRRSFVRSTIQSTMGLRIVVKRGRLVSIATSLHLLTRVAVRNDTVTQGRRLEALRKVPTTLPCDCFTARDAHRLLQTGVAVAMTPSPACRFHDTVPQLRRYGRMTVPSALRMAGQAPLYSCSG